MTTAAQLVAAWLGLALLACGPATAQISFPESPPSAAAPPSPPTADLPIAIAPVDPFSTIQVCAPINVLVIPANSTNYTVTAQAESSVLQSLVAVVQNGTLQLQSSGNFSTNTTISLQVSWRQTSSIATQCMSDSYCCGIVSRLHLLPALTSNHSSILLGAGGL